MKLESKLEMKLLSKLGIRSGTPPGARLGRWSMVLGLLLLAVGCEAKPASLTVSPTEVVMEAPGQTETLKPMVLDNKGKVMEGAPVLMKSSDEKVATVANNAVTARGSGEAILTVSLENLSQQVKVTVNIPARLDVGRRQVDLTDEIPTVSLSARVLNETGSEWPGKLKLNWEIEDSSVAALERGVLTGLKPGTTLVTVTGNGMRLELAVNSMVNNAEAALASHAEAVAKLPPVEVESTLPELPPEASGEQKKP